jgi:hypothetical protein
MVSAPNVFSTIHGAGYATDDTFAAETVSGEKRYHGLLPAFVFGELGVVKTLEEALAVSATHTMCRTAADT